MAIEICAGRGREWQHDGTKPICPVCLRGPRELNVPRPVRRLGIYEGTVPAHAETERQRRQAEIERANEAITAAGFERIAGTGRWRHPHDHDISYTWDEALADARMRGFRGGGPQ